MTPEMEVLFDGCGFIVNICNNLAILIFKEDI